jgi:hypothetical protein
MLALKSIPMRFMRALLALMLIVPVASAGAGNVATHRTLLSGKKAIGPIASLDFTALNSQSASFQSNIAYSTTSLRTLTDAIGKLTYAPNNLLGYSNTFNNSAWTKNTTTVASGVLDPLGGTTAYTLTAAGVDSDIYQYNVSQTGTFLCTFWARRRTGSGVVGLLNPNSAATNNITLTSSWQQFSTYGTVSNALAYCGILLHVTGDAIDVYAATTSAVTYETTPRPGDQVITTTAAYYGPAFDYSPTSIGTGLGLRIEEARTNLSIQSGDLTSGATNKAVGSLSTDGTLDRTGRPFQKLNANAGGGSHEMYNGVILTGLTASANYSVSIDVKAGTTPYVFITWESNSTQTFAGAVFNLTGTGNITATQTAVGTTSGTMVSATGVYMGNGIFRLTLVASQNTTNGYFVFGIAGAATGQNFGTSGDITFTAAGTESAYFGLPQVELGSFPTSYIPTAAASVTRAADVATIIGAGLTALQGAASTIIGEYQASNLSGVGYLLVADVANNPANEATSMIYSSSLVYSRLWHSAAIVFGASALSGTPSTVNPNRQSIAWDGVGGSASLNGGTVATATATKPNTPNTFSLGSSGGGSQFINGYIRSLAIYNSRLPDATLQSRSVVGAPF